MEESEYVLHINFEEIKAEIDGFQEVDRDLAGKIGAFMLRLKKATTRIEPTLGEKLIMNENFGKNTSSFKGKNCYSRFVS